MNYGKQAVKQRAKSLDAKGIKIGNKIGLWFGKLVLVGLLLFAVMGISAVIGLWKGIIDSAPEITALDVTPTGYSTAVYDSEGNEIATLVAEGANRKYVTIDEIPENLQDAFVAIEDARFYDHNGIDTTGIVRAFVVGVQNKEFSQGASTITQQLVKNNVLTSWTSETSMIEKFQRKIQEQYLAVELEKMVGDKKWILENYLNSINLGANTLGVQAASLKYFNKDVSELTLSECAVIAGITKNPSAYNPIRFPEDNAKRREKVLNNMLEQDYITKAEYEEAMDDNPYDRIAEYNTGNGASINSYYVDALIDDVYDDLINELGYSESDAYKALYKGGLNIYSAQNSALQAIVDEEVNNQDNYTEGTKYSFSLNFQVKYEDGTYQTFTHQTMLQYYKDLTKKQEFNIDYATEEDCYAAIDAYKEAVLAGGGTIVEGTETINISIQPQVAVTLIDNETGQVVALAGGRGDKEGNKTLNRATDTTRQPGSCFKIIGCYGAALDAGGLTLATVQDDAPLTVGEKQYKNWDGNYNGMVTIREAITQSMNIATVKNLQTIGIDLAYNYAQQFGISTLVEQDKNLGLCLGGLTYGVTNLELTAAYETIANYGVYRSPKFYTKVTDHDGNVLLDYSKTQKTHQVLREQTAWLLTSAMRDVLTDGSGTIARLDLAMDQAAKTGTTSNNRDSIFQGYTPYYSCGIWGGYDDNKIQDNTQYTKKLWKAIMTRVHADLPAKEFVMPNGIVTADVCKKSGLLPEEGLCDSDARGSMIYSEFFEEDTIPEDTCATHVAIDICSVSGQVAGANCNPETVTHGIYIVGAEEGSPEAEYAVTEEFLANVCTSCTKASESTTDTNHSSDSNANTNSENGQTPGNGSNSGDQNKPTTPGTTPTPVTKREN